MQNKTSFAQSTIQGAYRGATPAERLRHTWKSLPRHRRRLIVQAAVGMLVSALSVTAALLVVNIL